MPRYQVTAPDGRTVTLEGDTPPTDADLEGIFASLPPPKSNPADIFRSQMSRAGTFGTAPTQQDIQAGRENNIAGLTLGAMTAPAMIGSAIAAPVATAKAVGGSLVGGAVGNEAGQWVGRKLPLVGGQTAADVLGALGGLVGGIGGGIAGPKINAQELVSMLPGGGKGGMLSRILTGSSGAAEGAAGAEVAAAERAAVQAAKERASTAALELKARQVAAREAEAAAKVAERQARAESIKQVAEARVAAIKARTAQGGTRTPRTASTPTPAPAPPTEGATALQPEPDFIDPKHVKVLPFERPAPPPEPQLLPDEAVSVVQSPPPKGKATMGTNLGGRAKPGPPPTKPEDLEAALRASVKELSAEGLQIPRIQIGAERVGRQVGMLKEQVRQVAGPVLNEARGEASPIFPRKALESIVDKIRTIPMAEREAYVRAATSDKAMWQVETIRRTLEHLGLLIPAGVVAAGAMSEQ